MLATETLVSFLQAWFGGGDEVPLVLPIIPSSLVCDGDLNPNPQTGLPRPP